MARHGGFLHDWIVGHSVGSAERFRYLNVYDFLSELNKFN